MADVKTDSGFYSDAAYDKSLDSSVELQESNALIQHPFGEHRELDAGFDVSMSVLASVSIDLMRLMPRKFHTKQVLIDYLAEAGIQAGNCMTNVRNLIKLQNARQISEVKYLRYLGALIGVEFPPEDSTSTEEMRKNILNAVDWYKVKGTYQSIQIISIIQSFAINLYDMYTDDYETFVLKEWFVGDEDENPGGLDSSYYKSPHFGVEVLLNKVHESSSGDSSSGLDHLWETSMLNNLSDKVEETRPVHTVPHFSLLLNPQTDEFGNVIEVDGEIKTRTFADWDISTGYFDEESGDVWYFDEDKYFDASSDSFILSVTKWVIGIGSPDIESPSFAISRPVEEGIIDTNDITVSDDKITFEFTVPKSTVRGNMSELGLYIPGSPDKLVIGSTFPKIDKDARVKLRVLVEVHKTDLST